MADEETVTALELYRRYGATHLGHEVDMGDGRWQELVGVMTFRFEDTPIIINVAGGEEFHYHPQKKLRMRLKAEGP